jgi:uncharacterized membrane protein HdeD (DUF308 family)
MFKRIVTFLIGIGLIALGVLFFIEQERHFVVQILTQYWPIFLIIAGLVRISGYLIDRHPRSPQGGMIIMALGGMLLAANLRGEHSIVRIFGNYWFWLLLALIIGRILHQYTHRRDDGPRPSAFSPAAIALMVLIAGSGLAANYLARKTQPLPMNLGVANFVFGKQLSLEDPPQTLALSPNSRLIIDGAQANVEIEAAEQPQASARIIKKFRALSEEEARNSIENIRLQISAAGDSYRIGVSAPPELPQDLSTSIILTLPQKREIAVEVLNCTGSVKLTGLHGEYTIRNVDDVNVSDHTGSITIENPRGPVELRQIRGAVNLSGARGDSSITLEDIEGPASVEAQGDVTVRNFLDLLNIRTESGTIKLTTSERIGAEVKATNQRGRIQAFIPDDSDFSLDAASNRGSIRVKGFNRMALQRRERSNVFGFNGSNSGPKIILRANNGILVQSSGLVIASREDEGDDN